LNRAVLVGNTKNRCARLRRRPDRDDANDTHTRRALNYRVELCDKLLVIEVGVCIDKLYRQALGA
jgi:hypothetical protein